MKLIDYLEEVKKGSAWVTLPKVKVKVMKDSYLYLLPVAGEIAKDLFYRVTKDNPSFGLLKKLNGEVIENLKLDKKPAKYDPYSSSTKDGRIIQSDTKFIFKDTNINKNNPEKLV